LTVATSGITSLLLPGGRTTQSKFKIPIPALEPSSCDIDKGSDRAELIKMAKLITRDKAPMAHRFCFEALDRTLKDIMSGNLLYLVVILGRFYQLYQKEVALI